MTVVRNVGTAAGSIAANTTALQTAMNTAASDDVRIVLGANARFAMAWFSQNWTNFPMVIIAADRNNPPIMTEGFCLVGNPAGGEGWFGNRGGQSPNNDNGPFASQVQDVTFDGIHFIPRKLTQVTPRHGGGGNYTIQDPPSGGISWRIDPTFAGFWVRTAADSNSPVQGYGAGEAYMVFFDGLSPGAQNITIQNCFFDGGGRAVKTTIGFNGLTFRFNTWINWSEDAFFLGGGNNMTFEYNFFNQGRPISRRDGFNGWSYSSSADGPPPHTDAFQTFRPCSDLRFNFNVMLDRGRSHFFLGNINNDGGSHARWIVRNNYSEQADTTSIWVNGRCLEPIVENNKILAVPGGETPIFQVNNECVRATVRNNMAPNLNTNGNSTWLVNTGNSTNNNANLMPAGWVEMRPYNRPGTSTPWTPAGSNRAGQYGQAGGTSTFPPSFSTTPQLSPRPQVEAGDELQATAAAVSGNPLPTFANGMLTNRWFRNGVLIATQTDLTYPTVTGDIDDVFTYQTRANNGIGGNVDSSLSLPSTVIEPIIAPGAPVFTTAPTISPLDTVAGGVITAVQGVATGTTPINRTNRWFRNDILQAGVTGLAYTTLTTDFGAEIKYQTRATNSVVPPPGGVDSSFSNIITILSAGPPAGLTSGQVAFEALVQDPNFPDARRTFTIRVPSTSPAFDADAMAWTDDLVAPDIRPMTRLANQGGANILRAASAGPTQVGHLRSPNGSFVNVRLYYREGPATPLSLPSVYTFTETVPDEGNPDPILSSVININQTVRMTMEEGEAMAMVSTEFGTVWLSSEE